MATFGFDALGETTRRLFSRLNQRAAAALAGRSATARWGLVALVVGGLSLVGYFAASSIIPAERVFLGSGRRYQYDDMVKITRALDAQRVDYQIDDRRLSVPAKSAETAAAILAKLEIGPRSLDEIRSGAAGASLWESPRDRDEREQRERARVSETLINQLPGVVGSFVSVNRVQQRGALRPTTKPTAFVSLQTEAGRELPFSVIDSITSILTGNEAGLTPEAITVMDRDGRKYLDAGNPALSALSTNRAREEEVSRQILEKLDWITGVRVSVQLASPAPAAEPRPTTQIETQDEPAPATGLVVGVNQAMSLEPDPADAPPEPALEIAVAPEAEPAPEVAPRPTGRVWVSIPRSFYYNAGFLPGRDEPSREELRGLVDRTETQARNVVRLVCSEVDSTDWEPPIIDVIPDAVPDLQNSTTAADAARSRRLIKDWAAAGAAGATAAALVALGTWIFGARQSTRRQEPSRGQVRRHQGTAGAPPPTERVLEFVRRNPESAFGVLNRWTHPGGGRT